MELELWFAMASTAPRKSGSERSGSGGSAGRRRSRRSSGLHRHCLVTVAALVVVVTELPVGQALPRIGSGCGRGSGGGELRVPCERTSDVA